jgi:hypothetical protein
MRLYESGRLERPNSTRVGTGLERPDRLAETAAGGGLFVRWIRRSRLLAAVGNGS